MNVRVLAFLTLFFSPAVRADIIELTDGRKFNGTLVRAGDVVNIKTDDSQVITVKPADIAKVTLTDNLSPEEAAAQAWSRVGDKVKTAYDLKVVIETYKGFLAQYPGATQAAEARALVGVYETIIKSDPVKFRGRWLPRAQVDVVLKNWAEAARPALAAYKAGKFKDALDAAKAVLAQDSQNPDALTIGGLAAYRSSDLSQARVYFTTLTAADPTSLLAENNLAVLCMAQKQYGEAFGHYVKALQIMPDHRLLLDNVAEAIHTYLAAGGEKTNATYRNLMKAFDPVEMRMEESLARQHVVRWGATWVTADRRDRLAKAQQSLRDQWGQLDAQYATVRKTLASLDAQIRQATADCDNYADTLNTVTAQMLANTGRAAEYSFFAAHREVIIQNLDRTMRYRNQLRAQYDLLAAGTKDFLAQVERLKTVFDPANNGGQYTGTQRIIDLGETQTPPSPPVVADPPPLPALPVPTIVINPPPAPVPPVLVPIPVGVGYLVPVPAPAPPSDPGRGRGRGGPDPSPGSQPSTLPATQPTTSPGT